MKNNKLDKNIEKQVTEFFDSFEDEDEPYPWVSNRGDYGLEIRDMLRMCLFKSIKTQREEIKGVIRLRIETINKSEYSDDIKEGLKLLLDDIIGKL